MVSASVGRACPKVELHLLDTGHFTREEKADEIARLVLDFLSRTLPAADR